MTIDFVQEVRAQNAVSAAPVGGGTGNVRRRGTRLSCRSISLRRAILSS